MVECLLDSPLTGSGNTRFCTTRYCDFRMQEALGKLTAKGSAITHCVRYEAKTGAEGV